MICSLKDILSQQFFCDDSSSGSVRKSTAVKESIKRKPPLGSGFLKLCDVGGDLDAVMSIEISSSKIVAMIGVLNPRKEIEILGFGEQVLKNAGKRDTYNIIKTAAGIRSSVREAIEMSGVNEVKAVCINYSGRLFINRVTEVIIQEGVHAEIVSSDIEILKKKVHLVVFPPGKKTILIQAEHYTIDDLPNIVNPVGMVGKRLEASFCTVGGDVSVLRNFENCVSRADLHLTSAYPSAIASAEAVLLEEEKQGSVAVIDIGASTTHIAVCKNGIFIHAETLQLGGNNITRDIKEFTPLTFERAEIIKKSFNSLYPLDVSAEDVIYVDLFLGGKRVKFSARELAYVIEARVEELVSLAYSKVLDALNGLKPDLGIVITGGGAALFPNIEKFVKQLTGVRCYVGCPDLYLASNTRIPTDLFALLKSPVYATSIGLLRLGLKGNFYS